jgi:hypothetical protein
MDRVYARDPDGYIIQITLPPNVVADEDTVFKLNSCELSFDDDYWFDQFLMSSEYLLCLPDEVMSDSDVITAVDVRGGRRDTLWSWSSEKGDIILDGKLCVKNTITPPKPVEDDRCKACGAMGEIIRMACICPKCGMVVWGC